MEPRDLSRLPPDLPVPVDDGAAEPDLVLRSLAELGR
jgi:hypothetical protein